MADTGVREKESSNRLTFLSKAFAAQSATSGLGPYTIPRRTPCGQDVQIEILYCGVCHSDLHLVRDEWKEFMPAIRHCLKY
jgi:alcohol dehydrogenase (NADP+)